MKKEAMIFHGNEGLLQGRGDCRNRNVVALVIEPKPAAAVRGVKPCIADAACELVNRVTLLREPTEGHYGNDNEGIKEVLRSDEIGAE